MKGNEKAVKRISAVILLIGAMFAGVFYSTSLHRLIIRQDERLKLYPLKDCIQSLIENRQQQLILLSFLCLVVCVCIALFVNNSSFKADLYTVTPKIRIPKPYGQGQHGTAWWMSDSEFREAFAQNQANRIVKELARQGYDDLPPKLQRRSSMVFAYWNNWLEEKRLSMGFAEPSTDIAPFKSGGLVVALSKKGQHECYHFVDEDTHSLILGATRCGKTRCLVLPTIVNMALAGESMVLSDPKGELYQYTAPFLRRLGYNIMVINYKDMRHSMAYNLLQPIIDSFNEGNDNRAIQQARDVANILVGEKSKNGEPIWHNGELSVIAAIVIATVYDNMDKPENQNLTYVYEFLVRMCESKIEKEGGMPLKRYLSYVGDKHPANILLSQARISPEKTRGSFYTSAAGTLAIWTDRELYHISNQSDFDLLDIVKKKTAFFIILPDDKKSFYTVASLIVSQMYERLANHADITLGTGRLNRRLNFVLDEFGNFAEIGNFDTKLTVAGGRGIRFNLFLQSFEQLKEKYGDNIAVTIKSNCETWVYLKTNDNESREEMKRKLGTYTTSSYSMSASKNSNGSESFNLISRDLLTPDELGKLQRPYQLVCASTGKKVTFAPDLTRWKTVNQMLGLGSKLHNEGVRAFRSANEPIYHDVSAPVRFSDPIWNNF